jgi:pantothenate kinase
MSGLLPHKEAAVERVQNFINGSSARVLIGIAGKPGAGKSTLSQFISDSIKSEELSVVPMDGFHYSNAVLDKLGRLSRKGAPDTFDVNGFVALLKRIRRENNQNIYYPKFDRSIEESIAAQGEVSVKTKVVIIEGNYLLHQAGGWNEVTPLLDEIWFIDGDEDLRMKRLIQRHMAFGKSAVDAQDWAMGSDEKNAELIGAGYERADFIIRLN